MACYHQVFRPHAQQSQLSQKDKSGLFENLRAHQVPETSEQTVCYPESFVLEKFKCTVKKVVDFLRVLQDFLKDCAGILENLFKKSWPNMPQNLLGCSEENANVPDTWADNVVEDDIAAVVDVGGGEAPKEQENLDEAPEGDKARIL